MDAWTFTLRVLTGTFEAPEVRWPRALTRRYIGDRPDGSAPGGPSAIEAEVLAVLQSFGPSRPPAIAGKLHAALPTIHTRLCRMKARGLLVSTRGIWSLPEAA